MWTEGAGMGASRYGQRRETTDNAFSLDGIFSTGQKERLRGAHASLAEYLHQYNKRVVAWKDHFIQPACLRGEGKRELVGGAVVCPTLLRSERAKRWSSSAAAGSVATVTGRCHRGKARPSLSGGPDCGENRPGDKPKQAWPSLGLERGSGMRARGGGKGQRRRLARHESN